MEKIASVKFESELFREYSMTPDRVSLGMAQNEMTLYMDSDKSRGYIEWEYDLADGDGDSIEIGLWFDGNELADYDGVFSLPQEAQKLLEDNGYDIEYSK